MALSDIVQVTISILRAAVAAAGFGVPGIFGIHTRFAERYRSYTSLSGMAADGFLTSDAEYVAAQSLLAGDVVPSRFIVGKLTALVAQQADITFAAFAEGTYTVTVNGTAHAYVTDGSATAAEIINGLAALINAGAQSALVTASNQGPDTSLRILSDVPGTAFTYAVASAGGASTMTPTLTTANHGVQEDMDEIRAAGAVWYGTMQTSRVSREIRNLAAWTESNDVPPTIFMAQTSEATSGSAALDAAGTDVANILNTAGYTRTGLWWHSIDGEYADAAILGRELPVDPGSDNWALKELVGITPDSISDTYRTNLVGAEPGEGKNANIYYALTAQNNITFRGTMVSGDWIDVIRFVDFLIARIGEAVANLMLGSERVNFDELGLQQIAAQVSGVLQAAKDARKVSSFAVTVPDIADYTSDNRTARRLDPPITFSAQLSGALLNVQVDGSVTE